MIVLAIIGVLLALALPAIQALRESSRRALCQARMKELGIAIHAHFETTVSFPQNVGVSSHPSYLTYLTPFIDQQPFYQHYNFDDNAANFTMMNHHVAAFVCPSDQLADQDPQLGARTNFGINIYHPDNPERLGVIPAFRLERTKWIQNSTQVSLVSEFLTYSPSPDLRRSTFELGYFTWSDRDAFRHACETVSINQTIAVGRSRGIPWISGGSSSCNSHELTPNKPNCANTLSSDIYTASSAHATGVNRLFADGHVEFTGDSIDPALYRASGRD